MTVEKAPELDPFPSLRERKGTIKSKRVLSCDTQRLLPALNL